MKKITLIFICLLAMKNVIQSQTVMPLYPEAIPNSKPTKDEETSEVRPDGVVITGKISRPTLTIFLPEKDISNGTAVIIFPGGGYRVNASTHEGTDVAKEFAKMGVAGIVVKYRIPNIETMIDKEIGPLQDAQQAIKTVREKAAEWNVNPARIGIMGFSAGGHLASTAGTQYKKITINNNNNTSLRPDFMLLIYPVISLYDTTIAHKGSGEQLLGKNAPAIKLKEYSAELNVTNQTPPAFLVHASDDKSVSPKNSTRFYEALLQHNISAELHIYQSGGHGFGMNIKNSDEKWMERCKNWLSINGWLKK